jgi:hypothetical protein
MFPRNLRVRRSNNGRQMQLAKNVIDVGRVAVPERVSRSDARLPMRPHPAHRRVFRRQQAMKGAQP